MRSLLLMIILGFLAIACASGAPGPPGGIRLEGIEWRALSIAGQPPSPRNVPTLRLTGSTVSGSGGCNRYSGGARFEDGRLVIDGLAMTAMACLDDVANEREQQFITILSSRPLIGTRDGHLVLSAQGGEIVFESPGIYAGPSD
jgi:heat shock protein HslJ